MQDINLKSIVKEFVKPYLEEKINVDKDQLLEQAKNYSKEAEREYQNLPEPKIMSIETFQEHWVRESLLKDFNHKTLKEVSSKNSDPQIQALHQLFSIFPPNVLFDLQKK